LKGKVVAVEPSKIKGGLNIIIYVSQNSQVNIKDTHVVSLLTLRRFVFHITILSDAFQIFADVPWQQS